MRGSDRLFFEEEHHALRAQVRKFVTLELAPHVDAWESAKSFPREVYAKAATAGVLGIGFPSEYGGSDGDLFHILIVAEELTRSGSPGLSASLGSLMIGLPPILHAGTSEQKAALLPPVLSGEWIAALGITEAGAGSDVANIRTRAEKVDGGWNVNGGKMFITSGTRADIVTIAARTGGPGAGGVSLFAVRTNAPGFRVGRNLDKMGWHASDTAELLFEDMVIPDDALLGEVNGGFPIAMQNFATERLMLAVQATEIADMALQATHAWVEERQAFGRPLNGFQVTRHKLADMASLVESARAFAWSIAARVRGGDPCFAEVAMAKNVATDACSRVVDEAVQLFGGSGYMAGTLVERLYRDARLYPIGGGTREIMNEIISKFYSPQP
jgi:acyl-CoA dehydrogenase